SGVAPPSTGTGKGKGSTTSNATAEQYLTQASSDYTAAQTALSRGELGQYQKDVNAMNTALQAAENALNKGTTSSADTTSTTSTTTTTTPSS
ncbi:MAG: hypothetical protein WA580_04540, partial [Acidimicrobiales bacterium]